MAIFSTNRFEECSNTDCSYITGTVECAYDIAMEGTEEICRIISASYISDVLIEQSVSEGAYGEPLIEASVKEMATKFKNTLIKWKDKIVAWFKRIFDNFKVMITGTKKFAKKYKDAIQKKASQIKDYKPKRRKIDTTKLNDITTIMESLKTKIDTITNGDAADDIKIEKIYEDNSITLGADNIKELKTKIIDSVILEDTTEPITANEINSMLTWCLGSEDALKVITKAKDANLSAVNKMIETFTKNTEKADATLMNAKATFCKNSLNIFTALNSIAVTMFKTVNRQYVGLLKGVLYAKGDGASETASKTEKKKAEESFFFGEDDSIFESAMKLV